MLPFETPTQLAALILTLIAGWFLSRMAAGATAQGHHYEFDLQVGQRPKAGRPLVARSDSKGKSLMAAAMVSI